ncbi:hypothetical protein X798_07977 [Onchocerca flexuosa]|uniref:Uncharacterized protein n=1 Tax=Onchocerca flexuosa TaxID=387005 RepID=A0A238BK62_9BILA|nr:hypothetical protein X798_07977 [Onchocerca flexuosa]
MISTDNHDEGKSIKRRKNGTKKGIKLEIAQTQESNQTEGKSKDQVGTVGYVLNDDITETGSSRSKSYQIPTTNAFSARKIRQIDWVRVLARHQSKMCSFIRSPLQFPAIFHSYVTSDSLAKFVDVTLYQLQGASHCS